MKKMLVCYYSRSGTTENMAEEIGKGAEKSSADINVDIKEVKDVDADLLLDYDAIVIGSPTYYGLPAAEIKELIDESVAHHGELDGLVGGAFASSGNVGGGNETTIIGIIETLLIHGMIVMGDPDGDHYGPVSVDSLDDSNVKQCRRYGERIAMLTEQID